MCDTAVVEDFFEESNISIEWARNILIKHRGFI